MRWTYPEHLRCRAIASRTTLEPEGEYLLQIRHAADTELREGRSSDGTSDVLPVPVHTYSDFEQPLSVPGDLTGVVVSVPELPATSSVNAK
jgi:hypothetical protein